MKKLFFFLFIVLSFQSYSQSQQELEDFYSFTNRFMEATKEHSYKKLIKLANKQYKDEQLAMLEGRKEQFVNELYSGNNENGDWVNLNLDGIWNISLVEYNYTDNGDFIAIFEIETADNIITFPISIIPNKKAKKWGYFGAMG